MATSTTALWQHVQMANCSPTKSFLELPSEVRNKIYTHLYHFPNPIRLDFHQEPNSQGPKSIAPFMPNCAIPTSIFLTCRQINTEASSLFYSRNTFLLHRKVQIAQSTRTCFIAALLEFLAMIGSRASMLRNVVFDTFNICNNACHRTYLDWQMPLFDPATDVVEVTTLLQTVWYLNLNFKVRLINMSSVSEPRAKYYKQNPHLHRNTIAMAVIQSLLEDCFNLKRYRSLICAIAVKSDASGGIISWGSTPRGIHNTNWPRYYPHTSTEFVATDSGFRIQHVPRPRPQLLFLPAPIWRNIMQRVVFPSEGITIDVDTATTFPLGLPHVNRSLRANLWPTSILGNPFTLLMTTNMQRNDFHGFTRLRRLLRKTITYVRSDGTARELTLEQGQFGVEQIVLQFDLDTLVKHEDLRISILPLVMETPSSKMGYKRLTVRVSHGKSIWELSITLQKLRRRVVEALGVDIGETADAERGGEPAIWIDGLGNVVEKYAK